MKQPPKYKIALLIWIALYPSLNLLVFILGDHINNLPSFVRTFILTVILVPLIVFILMPQLTKLFQGWLSK